MKTCFQNKTYVLKINGSKFETHSFFVENVNNVNKILNNLKKDNTKAKHICYAYKIDKIFKYNDDGEPSGSAGKKILDVINISNLNNILIVIVRYMSGSKLGLGLLTSCYYNSALKVKDDIDNLVDVKTIDIYKINCNFINYNNVLNELLKSKEIIINKSFIENECFIYSTLDNIPKNRFKNIEFYQKHIYRKF